MAPARRRRWKPLAERPRHIRDTVADENDFVIAVAPPGPDWHLGSVVYEIFPDRFASSGAEYDAAGLGGTARLERAPGRTLEVAVRVVRRRPARHRGALDHIESLGASVVYLTPIFPAGTIHRYDANTFEHIDPLLGGDEALVTLTKAAHERGIRVVGDLTLNHVGSGHDWFHKAVEDPSGRARASSTSTSRCRTATWRGWGCRTSKARLPLAGAAAADDDVVPAGRSRPSTSTAGASTWRT